MCEANAYLYHDGKEELLLERVDKLIHNNWEIYLENIFGERKTIVARIKELRLVEHRIILEKIDEDSEIYVLVPGNTENYISDIKP